jgi:hypothetical protein
MDILLELASGWTRGHAADVLDWRVQEVGDVFFDLLAQARRLQSPQKGGVLDVGESAAQEAFHDVIIHYSQPRFLGELLEEGPE